MRFVISTFQVDTIPAGWAGSGMTNAPTADFVGKSSGISASAKSPTEKGLSHVFLAAMA
jgi:hypothetical protein